tara:strand:+ start:181 stop:615 length:435 start_codon:yes stop_codon:yes gene_type:complete
MSKLWDDLKKNMKDWGSAAVEKAEEVSKIAVAKTEELTKISKIKIDIRQIQKDQNNTHEKLGQFVAEHAKEDNLVNFTGNAEFFSIIKQLDEFNELIEVKSNEIQKIKAEYNLNESDINYSIEEEQEKKISNEESSIKPENEQE